MTTYNKFNKLNIDTVPLGIEQDNSDYNKIKFTEDYEDFILPVPTLPEWKVYFDGNFWGYSGRQRAGREILTNIQFVLNDKVWHIPSVYACSKGLVVDFCVQIPVQNIGDFMSKWNLSIENDGSDFTKEQQAQIDAENPMAINISPEIIFNGKTIPCSHGCGLSWNPCFTQLNSIESEGVLKQYELDPSNGWFIWRSAFPWTTARKPRISSLSVIIKHDPIEILGSHFGVSTIGERVDFTHPITNVQHTMTIQKYEQQKIPADRFGDTSYDYPIHYTVMSYTLYPDLPDGSFSIRDCNNGDRPRKKQTNPMEPQSTANCFAFGVISGADGPTAIAFEDGNQGKLHVACSALHFNPVNTVKWQIIFHEKPYADVTVKVI